MIKWLKNLFNKKQAEKPTKFVKHKYKVKMSQLYAHVGMQEYKYGNEFEYIRDPLCNGQMMHNAPVQAGKLTLIPYHKIDRIEAKVWEEEKEEVLVEVDGRKYTLGGVEIVEI